MAPRSQPTDNPTRPQERVHRASGSHDEKAESSCKSPTPHTRSESTCRSGHPRKRSPTTRAGPEHVSAPGYAGAATGTALPTVRRQERGPTAGAGPATGGQSSYGSQPGYGRTVQLREAVRPRKNGPAAEERSDYGNRSGYGSGSGYGRTVRLREAVWPREAVRLREEVQLRRSVQLREPGVRGRSPPGGCGVAPHKIRTKRAPPALSAGRARLRVKWPGPGSNRRPSAFQADARTN